MGLMLVALDEDWRRMFVKAVMNSRKISLLDEQDIVSEAGVCSKELFSQSVQVES
jgi:hypothetical protein